METLKKIKRSIKESMSKHDVELNPSEIINKDFGTALEKRRWFILLAFCLFSGSNAMLFTTYSPISSAVEEYYGIDEGGVLQFTDAFLYIYFVFSFFGSWLAYKKFTRSIVGAMFLMAIGAWMRYFADESYAWALVGQYFAAFSQNVVLFVPVLIADRWFPAEERTWAVTIGTLSNLIGWAFGFMFPTILVQNGTEEIKPLLKYQAIISTVPLVLGLFSIKGKPKIPPSYSAMVKLTDHASFSKEFMTIMKDIKFVFAAVCFGNLAGCSLTIASVIVTFLPSSASAMEQGYVGTVFIGSGILGGIIGTIYLSTSKSENYDPLLKVFIVIATLGLVSLALVIKNENLAWIYTLSGITGFGLIGFQPFGAQILAEMTFPVQESISVNVMMVVAQVFGVIGNSLSTAKFVGHNGMWSLAALIAPCVIYMLFVHKTEYKRQNADNAHKKIDESLAKSFLSSQSHTDKAHKKIVDESLKKSLLSSQSGKSQKSLSF